MNKIDILIKCIILIYRENELATSQNEKSGGLIKTVLNTMKDARGKSLTGGETSTLDEIIDLILSMINNPDTFDKYTIMQTTNLILKDKPNALKALEKALDHDLTENQLKRSLVILRNTLNSYYIENEMTNLVNRASYKLSTGRLDNEPIRDFVSKLINNLEALNTTMDSKDPGIVDEIDMANPDEVTKAFDEVKLTTQSGGKLVTGWKKLNKMLNGGFRKGEQWVVTALQHNFKSGFVQSLFAQLPTLNTPILKDPNKKPLFALFSFEDDMTIVTEFLYRYLYYNEFKVIPDLSVLTSKEVSEYITKKLTATGYHVKILRVNPSEWTYKHLFNKCISYEADGYEIHGVIIDYLTKMPTTGCIMTGAGGTDVRDLYTRVRDFFAARGILNITPHQNSTEALNLARSGITGFDFIEEVRNKNYYSDSKQIPQVVDGEIYLTKGKFNKQWALFVGKGKHRTPIITPDDDKQFVLMFPKGAPIPEDIHDTDEIINNKKDEDIDF